MGSFNTALAQLQHEVVGLRTPDLVRTDDDRLPILDVGLEALEPVSAPDPENPSRFSARRAISYPFCFAARKMRSMFSTVLFSQTLWPTAPHAVPFSLRTSFCGSMKTTAVSFRLNCTMCSSFSRTRAGRPPCLP